MKKPKLLGKCIYCKKTKQYYILTEYCEVKKIYGSYGLSRQTEDEIKKNYIILDERSESCKKKNMIYWKMLL